MGATGGGDAFNFLTDCVTRARRVKAGRRPCWEGWGKKKARQSKRTSIGEVAIVLHRALLGVLEVLVLYLDKLDHLGFGVKVVDKVVVGVGALGLDVDVARLARFGR